MGCTLPHTFIGIDAGARTGLAVWDACHETITRLSTLSSFWEAYDAVQRFPAASTFIVIEDPRQNSPTFDHSVPRTMRDVRRREKVSRDVGSNQREARLLAEGLERLGYRVCRVRPRSRKLGAKAFRRLTGYEGRTNAHMRDAGVLVFGLKVPPPLVTDIDLFYAPLGTLESR